MNTGIRLGAFFRGVEVWIKRNAEALRQRREALRYFVGNDSGITEFMMESFGLNHKEHIEHKNEGDLQDPLCDLCVLCGFYLPFEGEMLTARNPAICSAASAPPRFDDVGNV